MCGIVGIWNTSEFKELENNEILKNMLKAIHHRGPDDIGFWNEDYRSPGFGHRRLSIQDLSSSGHQPMISASGRFVIVFNGEIYNHFEIRKEIKNTKKYIGNWRGSSDTETLLEAIEIWPIEKVLNKIIGMFAFALWDRRDRSLIFARDRFGEKPFYYGLIQTNDRFDQKNIVFGSELSAFKSIKNSTLEINSSALGSFFKYGYIPAPLSIYSGIKKLSPGHLLKIVCNKRNGYAPLQLPKESQWYKTKEIVTQNFYFQKRNLNTYDYLKKLEQTLISSINYQTISDVPLGTFLSGGIDSSLITALLQSQQKDPISSFTISFPDDNFAKNKFFNEAPYAKLVADHLGTNHTEIALTYRDAQKVIPNLSKIYSEPFADSSQVPTFLVCSEAKRAGLSVMLSGDGGDELFGGYNRHKYAPLINKRFSNFNPYLKNIISQAIKHLPIKQRGLILEKKQKLYRAIKNSNSINSIYETLISIYSEEEIPLNNDWLQDNFITLNSSPESLTPSEQIMFKDIIHYLPADLLVKVDRASMNVSLETRTPFLDYRVAEMAWSSPLDFKIKKSGFSYKSKWALKEILKKYVPKDIIERPKSGFAMPIGSWLKGPLRNWADELMDPSLISEYGYLDANKIGVLWRQHLEGRIDNTSKIWTILMWQSWVKEWIR